MEGVQTTNQDFPACVTQTQLEQIHNNMKLPSPREQSLVREFVEPGKFALEVFSSLPRSCPLHVLSTFSALTLADLAFISGYGFSHLASISRNTIHGFTYSEQVFWGFLHAKLLELHPSKQLHESSNP